ncbi:MAG: hypothetical protein QM713_14640 [Arachnia sp.]
MPTPTSPTQATNQLITAARTTFVLATLICLAGALATGSLTFLNVDNQLGGDAPVAVTRFVDLLMGLTHQNGHQDGPDQGTVSVFTQAAAWVCVLAPLALIGLGMRRDRPHPTSSTPPSTMLSIVAVVVGAGAGAFIVSLFAVTGVFYSADPQAYESAFGPGLPLMALALLFSSVFAIALPSAVEVSEDDEDRVFDQRR